MSEKTVFDLFRHDVEAPRSEHYTHHFPGGRRALSTDEFFRTTAGLAEGLAGLGVGRGDRVMLLCENRPEWHATDLAVLSLGAADVPIYGTLTPAQIAYQANDSGAVAAIVDGPAHMASFRQIAASCPTLRHLVQIDGSPEPGVVGFAELVSSGASAAAGDRFWDRARDAKEDDLITVIYTSGTTGEPKGVPLTHRHLVENVLAAAPRVPLDRRDLALEFLPLCHVLERMLGYAYMWRAASRAYCSVYHVGELIAGIHPTIFGAVPRFFEKVQRRVIEVASRSPVKARMLRWALAVGREASHRQLAERPADARLAVEHRLADRLVLSKVRAALGGRVRYCISGGAALPLHVAEFFHAAGVKVLEGYGLTETSPVIAVNAPAPGQLRLGTVGKPLDNLELAFADDGELLVRGPSVMRGYWRKPAATAEAFDPRGFLRTGDIAALDDGGFLVITDRKKDLIVTAGGKNVAPQPIETELQRSPLVEHAVLVGEGRPFIAALFSVQADALARWAAQQGIVYAELAELTRHERVVAAFGELVHGVNAGHARYEQIKEFRILPSTLSIEGGQLTPTLKVKRRVVEQEWAALIDDIYSPVAV